MSLVDDITLLYDSVEAAASRGAVTELLYLWAPTPWLEERGITIRTAINSIIPVLASHFGIPITRDMRFPEFVKLYDEYVYNSIRGTPDKHLGYFAERGNWRAVQTAINKGASNWNRAMKYAAKGGHKDLVNFFATLLLASETDKLKHVQKGAYQWSLGLQGAAEGNHKDIFEFFVELILVYDKRNLWIAAQYAAICNYKDIIDYLKAIDGTEYGLFYLCY